MNPVLHFLETRRSIRKFTLQPVEQEKIDEILRIAMLAPSAVNQQPWDFIVIDDPSLLSKMEGIHRGAGMAKNAPLAIAVCGDFETCSRPDMVPQDCSAAIMNILYAAHGLQLGAVWCGFYPIAERIQGLRTLLGIPEPITPFGLVVLGYPDQDPGVPDRMQRSKIHRNTW